MRRGAWLAAVSLPFVFLHCGASSDLSDGEGGLGGSSAGLDRPGGTIYILGSTDPSGNQNRMLNSLCGKGACVPDDQDGCGLPGGWGGAGGESSYGFGGGGGATGNCSLVVADSCTESCVERECITKGALEKGDVCAASDECGPGLACVGEGQEGTCEPVCCRGTAASCDANSFCDTQTLVGQPSIEVPVCRVIESCPLAETYPCPTGETCACDEGRACMVVRSDGRTACAEPGNGTEGAPCTGIEFGECAPGFVCASSRGCLKLCDLTLAVSGCPSAGTCQAPAEFPAGLGVCVPGTSSSDVAP